jgi:hypothetical protein
MRNLPLSDVVVQLQQVEALDAIESSEELRATIRGRTEQAELAKRYRQLRGHLAPG